MVLQSGALHLGKSGSALSSRSQGDSTSDDCCCKAGDVMITFSGITECLDLRGQCRTITCWNRQNVTIKITDYGEPNGTFILPFWRTIGLGWYPGGPRNTADVNWYRASFDIGARAEFREFPIGSTGNCTGTMQSVMEGVATIELVESPLKEKGIAYIAMSHNYHIAMAQEYRGANNYFPICGAYSIHAFTTKCSSKLWRSTMNRKSCRGYSESQTYGEKLLNGFCRKVDDTEMLSLGLDPYDDECIEASCISEDPRYLYEPGNSYPYVGGEAVAALL